MSEQTAKVVTGKVRFCYANVFKPTAINDTDEPKYNVCILIPKKDKATLDKIKKAIEAAKEAGKAKLAGSSGKIPSNIKTPLRDGDDERPDDPAFAGCYFINANSRRKPGIVDRDMNEIIDPDEFYSGCYGRASLNFYAFNVQSKGIAAGLNNLQKLAEGERLMGGSTAEDDFSDDFEDDDIL